MDAKSIVIMGAVVILAIFAAGGQGFLVGSHDAWSPRDYTAPSGQIVVLPQGDPLYDAHYAQQVNPYNAEAWKVQAQAKQINEQTRKAKWETNGAIIGVYSLFSVVVAMLALLVFVVFRG
jgi:hypothetical protein